MRATSFLTLLIVAACASKPPQIVGRVDGPLEQRRGKFRQCYMESDSYRRETAANERRTLSLAFTLAPDGRVMDERIIKSDFKDPNLHQCVLWLTRETRFAPGPSDTTVHVLHPLNFRSNL